MTPAQTRLTAAQATLRALIESRQCSALAGSPRTLARIRLAITSAQGAIRHAEGRAAREGLDQ